MFFTPTNVSVSKPRKYFAVNEFANVELQARPRRGPRDPCGGTCSLLFPGGDARLFLACFVRWSAARESVFFIFLVPYCLPRIEISFGILGQKSRVRANALDLNAFFLADIRKNPVRPICIKM